VAQGNFTPTLPRIRTWQSPVIRLLSSSRQANLAVLSYPLAPPISGWPNNKTKWSNPFAPFPLQELPYYYELVPLCPASVLSFLWVLHLNFSLIIGTTGSHVAHESLNQVHAASIPDAIQPVNRYHLNLSRDNVTPRFWHRLFVFDTWSAVHFYSSPWFIPDRVSPCLFLNAHHNGSLPLQLKAVWSLFL